MSSQILRFADFELDAGRKELRRAGDDAQLHPTPLRLLQHLVANRDRFVSKAELMDVGWPDRAVSESSLSVLEAVMLSALRMLMTRSDC